MIFNFIKREQPNTRRALKTTLFSKNFWETLRQKIPIGILQNFCKI